MDKLTKIPTTIQDGQIIPEESRSEIGERVIDGEIIVLKDVFDAADLLDLRNKLFEWGQETPEIGSSTEKRDTTFHSVDVNPEEGSHPKVYHSFNFSRGG
jgi:hypothetical protein